MTKKTILIVDDRQDYYPKELFENYRFYVVSNMMGAIKNILLQRPRLIIVNINLYEDNVSILTHILKVNKDIPIIAVTGDNNANIDNFPQQVITVFSKPIFTKTLIEAIETAPLRIEYKKQEENTLAKGKKIDNYEVIKTLGSGASGTVYKATDGKREVAIKILKAQFNNDMKRFSRETKYLMAIDHPNVIKGIYACQLDNEFYYIVMEIFEADHLSKHLSRQDVFSLAEAIFIIGEIAKGMAAAHKLQLIHRDLKPSNVLYDRRQKKVKIIDFGIAKKPEDYSLTTEGTALGTPAFMAPEQIFTHEIDYRVDIYSLGIIFYNLIIGNPPFDGREDHVVMRAQMYDEVSWPNDRIPQNIRSIIEKMLEKNREKRFQSMDEIENVLKTIK
ncbi:protein kinase [Candidatus Uabimicrobium sp. HlEnr_7]|uniref:serine/threonine protein kinase n=1 Tax=Candidatus Uabimicrobium helgolandensis TaxID=3095367 RepID=UPI003558AC79